MPDAIITFLSLSTKEQLKMGTQVSSNDEVEINQIEVIPEAQMEEGVAQYNDVIAEPVDASSLARSAAATHALTGSNRFVPVAEASAIPEHHPGVSIEEQEDRPDLLSATVWKSSRQAVVGIVLTHDSNSNVVVKRIDPTGLLGASGFRTGDRLVSVNKESCEGLDKKGVVDMIRNVDSILTIVVQSPNGRSDMVSSMVMTDSVYGLIGLWDICFRSIGGKLVISSIAEDGLFAHSLLNISDTCISINGIQCDEDIDSTAAKALVLSSRSSVTITAKTRHETGVVVAASSAEQQPAQASTSNSAEQQLTRTSTTTASHVTTAARPRQRQQSSIGRRGWTPGTFCCFLVIVVFALFIFLRLVAPPRD